MVTNSNPRIQNNLPLLDSNGVEGVEGQGEINDIDELDDWDDSEEKNSETGASFTSEVNFSLIFSLRPLTCCSIS